MHCRVLPSPCTHPHAHACATTFRAPPSPRSGIWPVLRKAIASGPCASATALEAAHHLLEGAHGGQSQPAGCFAPRRARAPAACVRAIRCRPVARALPSPSGQAMPPIDRDSRPTGRQVHRLVRCFRWTSRPQPVAQKPQTVRGRRDRARVALGTWPRPKRPGTRSEVAGQHAVEAVARELGSARRGADPASSFPASQSDMTTVLRLPGMAREASEAREEEVPARASSAASERPKQPRAPRRHVCRPPRCRDPRGQDPRRGPARPTTPSVASRSKARATEPDPPAASPAVRASALEPSRPGAAINAADEARASVP